MEKIQLRNMYHPDVMNGCYHDNQLTRWRRPERRYKSDMSHKKQELCDSDAGVDRMRHVTNAFQREYSRKAEMFGEMLLSEQFSMQALRRIMSKQEDAVKVDRVIAVYT